MGVDGIASEEDTFMGGEAVADTLADLEDLI
jgi:hypothetical protein